MERLEYLQSKQNPGHRVTPSISDAVGIFYNATNSLSSSDDDRSVEATGEFYVSGSELEDKYVFN